MTRAELLGAGVSDRRTAGLVGKGLLARVCPGTYRWQATPPTWRQQAMAAVKASGLGALLSHQSAAALWELAGFRPGSLHVTVPRRLRHGVRWTLHEGAVGEGDRAVVDGIPVVRVPLALVQVAATVSSRRLEDAVDDAMCRRLVTLDELTAACRRGRGGSGAVRRVAGLWAPEDRPATLAEARLLRRLLERGVPRPVLQYEVLVEGQLVARVDLAYPDHRVAVEYDSFRWHEPRRSRRDTMVRRNRLEGAGWHVLVATDADRADGGAHLAAVIDQLLARPASHR